MKQGSQSVRLFLILLVVFFSLPLWSLSGWAQADSITNFNIGDISPQTVWHGQKVEFLVHSDDLGAGTTLAYIADPQPVGTLSFDPSAGLFSTYLTHRTKIRFFSRLQRHWVMILCFRPWNSLPCRTCLRNTCPLG